MPMISLVQKWPHLFRNRRCHRHRHSRHQVLLPCYATQEMKVVSDHFQVLEQLDERLAVELSGMARQGHARVGSPFKHNWGT